MTRLLTIATSSHVPMAAVLLESAARHHPDWERFLLLADLTPDALKARQAEGLGKVASLLCCADLGVPELDRMRRLYDALEFCCALKIFGLDHLQRDGAAALFLDSDMLIRAPLEGLRVEPGKYILTPHSRTPMPKDGCGPDDRELCMAGFANGGVLAAGPGSNSSAAAHWLRYHLRAHCFQAPGLGMYSDQLWLAQMCAYFPDTVSLCDDPAINAAYWNLHERPLTLRSGAVTLASGRPLALFHFSGFPGEGRISRLSGRRFDDGTERALLELSHEYGAHLDEARRSWRPYRGDLGFASGPVEQRIAAAQAEWQDPELRLQAADGIASRIRRHLGRLAGGE
jgi:hypothetical protein